MCDWRNPANNVYHVAAEFAVERTAASTNGQESPFGRPQAAPQGDSPGMAESQTCRPDIVLFVNGIPFAVIECKSPKVEVEQGISQMIRNQRDEYIPRLFTYVQTVLAVNKNEARYATTGTPAQVLVEVEGGRDGC